MTTQAGLTRPAPTDQRRNHRLRERFDTALEQLRPLHQQAGSQRGATYFRALSKLHERFPDMTQNELEALAVAVMRALNSR